jgi:hypothetical protein
VRREAGEKARERLLRNFKIDQTDGRGLASSRTLRRGRVELQCAPRLLQVAHRLLPQWRDQSQLRRHLLVKVFIRQHVNSRGCCQDKRFLIKFCIVSRSTDHSVIQGMTMKFIGDMGVKDCPLASLHTLYRGIRFDVKTARQIVLGVS